MMASTLMLRKEGGGRGRERDVCCCCWWWRPISCGFKRWLAGWLVGVFGYLDCQKLSDRYLAVQSYTRVMIIHTRFLKIYQSQISLHSTTWDSLGTRSQSISSDHLIGNFTYYILIILYDM